MRQLRNYLFKNYLEDGEKILDTAHKHIIKFKLAAAKASTLGVVAPILVYYIFPTPQIFVVAIMWLIVGLGGLLYHFLDWYYDVWLITNLGVVAIRREGFFDVATQRIDYHFINDVSYTIKGVLATLLNYGDLNIDKMAASVPIVLHDAASPRKVERKIAKYRDIYLREKSFRDHDALKGMIGEMISYHVTQGYINPNKNN